MPKVTTKLTKEKAIQSNITELDELIISVLNDTKGEDILKLEFPKNLGMLFDTFIVCSATSHVHANALTGNVIRSVREQLKIRPKHVEGETNAEWILIDYFNTVVHIFMKEKRTFYDLENLWDDTAAVIRSNT